VTNGDMVGDMETLEVFNFKTEKKVVWIQQNYLKIIRPRGGDYGLWDWFKQ